MKKRKEMACVIAFLGIGVSNADTITSVHNGGLWSDTLSWVGKAVPGINDSVLIHGTVSIDDSAACGQLTITDSGVLQNSGHSEHVTLAVTGSLINNGTLRNNPDSNELWLELSGDMYNAGIWKPARTYIASRKKQTVSQMEQSRFEGSFFTFAADSSTDTFSLVATSNLKFYNAKEFDCMKRIGGMTRQGKLDMEDFDLLLADGSYLSGVFFLRTKKVTCLSSSMIGNSTFKDPVQVCGNFQVAVQSVCFNDTLTVQDTLENGVGGCCIAQGILFARGGIVNKGVIRDNPNQYELWCQIGGNVRNAGTWTNSQNTITDSIEQVIKLENGRTISALFQFDGMWPGEPYSWQKDGQYLTGDTIRLLSLDSLTASSAGTYRCGHDTGWSRTITVLWDTAVDIGYPEKRAFRTPPTFGCNLALGRKPIILFQTPYVCSFAVSLYDIRGKMVEFTASTAPAGDHSIVIPCQRLAAGSYIVKFRTARFEKVMGVAIVR